MREADKLGQFIINASSSELIRYCYDKNYLLYNIICNDYNFVMKLESSKGYLEDHCWRCYTKEGKSYHKRNSILCGSFLESVGGRFRTFFRVLCRISGNQPFHSIHKTIDISRPTLHKYKKMLIDLMKIENSKNQKLGGLGKIVHVNETTLNFKCKSHRGRSPHNKTDAICLVECDKISGVILRFWAEVIPNKEAATIIPVILAHVHENSTIHTDEHKSYSSLYNTVCHKYNFVDKLSGVHTSS